MSKIDVFWLVWNPNGKYPPKRRHTTRDSAIKEAFRMAREVPGDQFFVLESCGAAQRTDVQWLSARDADEEIPF
jgi:hypothetical protein